MPTVQELFDLTGKTALITGASGYLGRALAAALAEAGARVIVSSREQEKANETAATLGGVEQGRHLGIAIDQLKEDSIQEGFAAAVEQAGKIDILVNNGNFPVGEDWTTVSGEQFNRQLSNATGYFLLAREFRNHVVKSGRSGSVIMLGSMYGVVGSYPEAYAGVTTASPVAYHALKGGIVHLTRHLAVYWAQDNVRVNCLSPGPFPSEKAPQAMVERLKQKSPMGRMGHPDELKGAIVFLASEASSYVTGQNLLVDGGWTAW